MLMKSMEYLLVSGDDIIVCSRDKEKNDKLFRNFKNLHYNYLDFSNINDYLDLLSFIKNEGFNVDSIIAWIHSPWLKTQYGKNYTGDAILECVLDQAYDNQQAILQSLEDFKIRKSDYRLLRGQSDLVDTLVGIPQILTGKSILDNIPDIPNPI